MTSYNTSRRTAARANLESCRVKVASLEAERDTYAHIPAKAAKLAPQLAGALAALAAADQELAAAEAVPLVPLGEPAERVVARAQVAEGAGKANA